jgi:phosphoribosylamine---glycine ligase
LRRPVAIRVEAVRDGSQPLASRQVIVYPHLGCHDICCGHPDAGFIATRLFAIIYTRTRSLMNPNLPKLKVAVVGKDGRTSAIKKLLEASPLVNGPVRNASPGNGPQSVQETIAALCDDPPDFVVVGPEGPLAAGIVDELRARLGVPCIGPTRSLARLESSKSFTRKLLADYKIHGNPEHRIFDSIHGVEEYLLHLGDFVIKPDGLTGGKGVKVSGDHLHSVSEGVEYCRELLSQPAAKVVVEEKLDGEEFSLQSFCDGSHVKHMVVVQDHKRAYDGDTGPNTGGMGSYTCADHLLPFIEASDLEAAKRTNELVAQALLEQTGEKYKGILFGGFMATASGVKVLEYNARFGDPEALNVLSILYTDLAEIFLAILHERLDEVDVHFRNCATVCRYIVPSGYPTKPVCGLVRNIPAETDSLKVYLAAVDQKAEGIWMTGSRAVALVGIGCDLAEANALVEAKAELIQGNVFYRKDIGTPSLFQRRIDHMRRLRPHAFASQDIGTHATS